MTSVRPSRSLCSATAHLCRQLASQLLRNVRVLNRLISDLDALIWKAAEALGAILMEVLGIGPRSSPRRLWGS